MYLYGELTEDLTVMSGESPVLLINEVLFFSIGDMSAAYKTRLFNIVRGTSLPGFNSFCALYNGDPENGGAELAGGNYARAPLTFSVPEALPGGMSVIRNAVRADFPRPTVNLGNWTHTAVFDAETAGQPVFIQQRPTPKMVNRGVMPFVEAGNITVGIN